MSSGHLYTVRMHTICNNAATITVNRVQADYIDVHSLYSFIVRFHE